MMTKFSLFATKIILEKGGYEVFMAEDGKTGVEDAEINNSRIWPLST